MSLSIRMHEYARSWHVPHWARSTTASYSAADLALALDAAHRVHDRTKDNTDDKTSPDPEPEASTAAAAPPAHGAGKMKGVNYSALFSATPAPAPEDPALRGQIEALDVRLTEVERAALELLDNQNTVVEQSLMLTQKAEDAIESNRALDAQVAALTTLVSQVRTVEYVVRNGDTATRARPKAVHSAFDKMMRLVNALDPADRNVWITGPAGGGKTKGVELFAELLGLEYGFSPPLDQYYKVTGFRDGAGHYEPTAFRRIYGGGGVFLFDECDGANPNAMLELNTALANNHAAFPDGIIKRHPRCYIFAAANTWGHGGDANYIGRYKLDGTSLDRFVTVSWQYDEALEDQLAGLPQWVTVVRTVRRAAIAAKADMIIGPRSSIKGATLLRNGLPPDEVIEAVFGKYRSHSMWPTVGKAVEEFGRLPLSAVQLPRAIAANVANATNSGASPDPRVKRAILHVSGNGKTALPTLDMSAVQVFGSAR